MTARLKCRSPVPRNFSMAGKLSRLKLQRQCRCGSILMTPGHDFKPPVGTRKPQVCQNTAARPHADACAVDDHPAILAIGNRTDDYQEPESEFVSTNRRIQGYALDSCVGEHPGIHD